MSINVTDLHWKRILMSVVLDPEDTQNIHIMATTFAQVKQKKKYLFLLNLEILFNFYETYYAV